MDRIEELSLTNLFSLYQYIASRCDISHFAANGFELIYSDESVWPRSIYKVVNTVGESETMDFLRCEVDISLIPCQ